MTAVRWSTLKSILRSPAHYRRAVDMPREDSDAMRIGRATHALILEPRTFNDRWAVWAGGRRAGKEWDAWRADLGTREQLNADEYEQVAAMAVAVSEYAPASRLLCGGRAEVEIAWKVDGVKCGGRADYIGPRGVVDLKTTRDASPRAFGAEAHRMLYHAQLAWYAHGAGVPSAPLSIIAVEKGTNVVAVYEIDDVTRALAERTWRDALQTYAACERSDRWPGYQVEASPLEIPAYAFPVTDDLEMAMEGMSDG